jgi:hypothetical protein
MIKPFADYLKTDTVIDPLDISPCLSQGMGTIIALQSDGSCPSHDHSIDGVDIQGDLPPKIDPDIDLDF